MKKGASTRWYGPSLRTCIEWIKCSAWAFPVGLAIIVVAFTALRISGTSVAMYDNYLYGTTAHDTNLLYGQPRPIRSDEWMASTQEIISQAKNNFPVVNPDMVGSQNVSLQTDIPTKEWSALFKPQLWCFFIMPLQNAFAFKWWVVMYLLMVSCYFFALRVLKGNKLFAAMLAFAIGISPFELWWYQSGAFLVLAYAFFILILAMRVVGGEPIRRVVNPRLTTGLYAGGLVFLLSCFGILFYPPFQIPVAIVMLFFMVGYLIQKKTTESLPWKDIAKRVAPLFVSLLVAGLIGLLFIYSHQDVLHALNNSIYPGHRVAHSGSMNILQVFDSFVMPILQSDPRGAHFFINQSEASNFILILPFLILPGAAVLYHEWRARQKLNWILLALEVCAVLFFARAFVPHGNFFYKFLLLNRVPNDGRFIIGFGFLGILLLLYFVQRLAATKLPIKRLLPHALLYGLSCFLILLWTASHIRENYPMFLHNWAVFVALAAAFTSIVVAFVAGWHTVGVSLLLGFTMLSSFRIMPLYRGLGVLDHGAIIHKIAAVSPVSSTWVTIGDGVSAYENFGIVAGRASISGLEAYPQPEFWDKIAGPAYRSIYNREGHAFYTDNPGIIQPIQLIQNDAFAVKFQCSSFILSHAQFALAVKPLSESCVKLISTVSYPKVTFYLYKIAPN